MAEPLKNLYSEEFYTNFYNELNTFIPSLDKKQFFVDIFCNDWEAKELKERLRHTTQTLRKYLPNDIHESIELLKKLSIQLLNNGFSNQALEYMFIPDYLEVYALDKFDECMVAFHTITKFTSCEFAIRPFIINEPIKSLQYLKVWAIDEDENVRRLSSEGCRPRLPWAIALPFLKEDPSPILPILKTLNDDPSEYVRKSVANNLNDISKDNPHILIETINAWKNKSAYTDWILKHASRTLLKQGEQNVLRFFGFSPSNKILVEDFSIHQRDIHLNDELSFSFKLVNSLKKDALIRLEYAIYYVKANGKHSKKVFMISEKKYSSGSVTQIDKKQSFKPITTRKHYPGIHYISIIVNGVEKKKHAFSLQLN